MKIFINIASYRDPLLLNTINSAYENAHNKENLIFGIVEQETVENAINIDLIEFKNQIRYIRIDPVYARGSCWPRHMAQTLWQGEEYYLQIDSHTLFELDWDKNYIDQYNELKLYHEKPLITGYPHAFSLENNDITKLTKQVISGCVLLVANGESSFKTDSNMFVGARSDFKDKKFAHGYLISGGNIFTSGKIINEVPYDPFLYFCGEENSLALRLWTNGYNIFHTNSIPIYHRYNTETDSKLTVWGDEKLETMRLIKWWEYDAESIKRLTSIVTGEDLGVYGIGKTRTLEQYIKFSGIDYITKTIKERAKTGEGIFELDYKESIAI